MNTITRRIATAAAAVALAGSAVAVNGPAAFAGKPGGGSSTPAPITVVAQGQDDNNGSVHLAVAYDVPVASSEIQSVSCTMDGVAQDYCGDQFASGRKVTSYGGYVLSDQPGWAGHTFSVVVTTKKKTYTGSTIWDHFAQ